MYGLELIFKRGGIMLDCYVIVCFILIVVGLLVCGVFGIIPLVFCVKGLAVSFLSGLSLGLFFD